MLSYESLTFSPPVSGVSLYTISLAHDPLLTKGGTTLRGTTDDTLDQLWFAPDSYRSATPRRTRH